MQDGKNLIIAILLCLVVIVGWSYVSEYMGWVRKPDPAIVAQQQQAQQTRLGLASAQAQRLSDSIALYQAMGGAGQ